MHTKPLATALAILATIATAGTAHAGDGPFTANVGLVSDYAYRGWIQTDERPALQGGFDYAHDSGLYAGVWGSNVSWLSDANTDVSNSLELDLYGGYKGTLGAIGYDVGLLQYYYPGSYPKPYNSPNTLEGYVGLSWEFLSFKYSYAFTDLFGYEKSDGSQYYDLGAAIDISHRFGQQLQPAALGHGLDGIERQVEQHLLQFGEVAVQRQAAALEFGMQLHL